MLNRTAVDALLERAHREVDDGLLPGCQVALAMNGEVEVFESYGDANADTRYVVFSCTKPIVASAIWLLHARLGWTYDTRFALALFGLNVLLAVPLFFVLDRGRLISGSVAPGEA